jgi:hypothetical protein
MSTENFEEKMDSDFFFEKNKSSVKLKLPILFFCAIVTYIVTISVIVAFAVNFTSEAYVKKKRTSSESMQNFIDQKARGQVQFGLIKSSEIFYYAFL